MKKTAYIITTINKPVSLEGFCKNAVFYKHKNIDFFVVGDKKTPAEVPGYCEQLSSKYSIPVYYMGLKEQDKMIDDYKFDNMFPYNDANRRFLGMIKAYIEGYESFVLGDDDNFATNHDFFKHHDIVGTEKEIPLVESPSGWFNTCEFLIEEHNMPFYHRGYPWSKRKVQKETITIHHGKRKVVVNAGLWLDDPDVDAVTRLYYPVRAVDIKKEMTPHFGLFPRTWCPFNNQNTAIAREVLPAYFTIHHAKRYADVFPSFVVCKIAGHLDHVISYGYPLVRQIRNEHNLWVDMEDEMYGAQSAEIFIDLLRSSELSGKNYHDCIGDLNEHLDKNRKILTKLPDKQKKILLPFIDGQKVYHDRFDLIEKDSKKHIKNKNNR